MKKFLCIFSAVAAFLVACNKEIAVETPEGIISGHTNITFNLTANHPDDNADTRAVKQGWERGDVIFVFFDNQPAPKHLKMLYDGSVWEYIPSGSSSGSGPVPVGGSSSGNLEFTEGQTGMMRAVYLPFGNGETVYRGTSDEFKFSKVYYAYYATAALDYKVTNNTVSGSFDMVIPDGYVQFHIHEDEAMSSTSGGVALVSTAGYTLATDAVTPAGLQSVLANTLEIVETSDKGAGDEMTGYSYGDGFLFSGRLKGDYPYGGYYFTKTMNSNGIRQDYFVKRDRELKSHSAIKLPAIGDGRWVSVGSDVGVVIEGIAFKTCNYGCTLPEQRGSSYAFDDANALQGVTLPSKEQFEKIVTECGWTWLTVHGHAGTVVKGSGVGFIFLPSKLEQGASRYWSSTEYDIDNLRAWNLYFASFTHNSLLNNVGDMDRRNAFLVRAIQN